MQQVNSSVCTLAILLSHSLSDPVWTFHVSLKCRRHGFDSWVGKIPWRREWLLMPGFLPGEFHGQKSLAGYIQWSCKELDRTMEPHSSNLAWKILWM